MKGFEAKAFNGFRGALDQSGSRPCYIFLEFYPAALLAVDRKADPAELLGLMDGLGYDIYLPRAQLPLSPSYFAGVVNQYR